jgi:hypothetical protein
MAIFGNLSDLPFPEIFNMIGRHNGRLVITDLPGDEIFELELAEGSLRSLRIEDEQISDTFRIWDRLASLMETSHGAFVFQRSTAEELHGKLNLPLPALLVTIAVIVDEMKAYRGRFSPPSTRFKKIADEGAVLDDDLDLFPDPAAPLLVRGTTAQELSREVHLSVAQVQLNLYKLCSAGWIAPVDSLDEEIPAAAPPDRTPAAASPSGGPPAAEHDQESSVLNALRRRIKRKLHDFA